LLLLKQEFLGPTTQDLGVVGPIAPVSTYDLFVVWHHLAMFTFTPANQTDRNAAHRGPVFLPWHRFMLLLLELQFQRVLNDDEFGLPYWDWAADGELSPAQQRSSAIWGPQVLGGDGDPVSSGPFAFNASDPTSWRVRIHANFNGQLVSTDRGLRRALGQGTTRLPTKQQTATVLNQSAYDAAPWTVLSSGFRNRLEGWIPASQAPALHNRVHVWVGGDMMPSSSPNDPVFYLNHCNVDRIWQAWLEQNGDVYVPAQNEPESLRGHRINDAMNALLSQPLTPAQVLDVSDFYSYDNLTP
jgi:tyrosinase